MTNVDVWFDYVCPFAYVGYLRMRRAAAGGEASVGWRPFELHPETPPHGIPRARLLAGARDRGAWRRPGLLRGLLEEDALDLNPPDVQFNSRLALQAAEYARDAGRFDAFHDRLFHAAFREGRDLGRLEVLHGLAAEVGLDADDLVASVTAWRYLDRIVDSMEEAMSRGITGTPGFWFPSGRVLRGVQSVETLEHALLAG